MVDNISFSLKPNNKKIFTVEQFDAVQVDSLKI